MTVMGSAAITVEGVVRPSAKVTVLPVPAGLAWLALAVAACARVCTLPGSGGGPEFDLELATDTASIQSVGECICYLYFRKAGLWSGQQNRWTNGLPRTDLR